MVILCGINNIPRDPNEDVVQKFKTLVEDILKLNPRSVYSYHSIHKPHCENNCFLHMLIHRHRLLYKFHVMKYFKKKISDLNCLKDEKQGLGILVQKLINCKNEEDYNEYHTELSQFNAEFVTYFDKNWHSCRELWVMHPGLQQDPLPS